MKPTSVWNNAARCGAVTSLLPLRRGALRETELLLREERLTPVGFASAAQDGSAANGAQAAGKRQLTCAIAGSTSVDFSALGFFCSAILFVCCRLVDSFVVDSFVVDRARLANLQRDSAQTPLYSCMVLPQLSLSHAERL